MNFEFVFLGQSVLKYQVPYDIYISINHIYESKFKELKPANKQLVGKIKNEHSLFYNGNDQNEMKEHNLLSLNILKWFESCYKHYLEWNKIKDYHIHLNSIWVNEMKEHEYNPVHVHQGTLFSGLSSVMILKLPQSFGVEYSSSKNPQNGKLQMYGSSSGQFANIDYQPDVKERDFYVFPYDMRHSVYPFNGPGVRRTLAANCDVDYNPTQNRGIS
tara:strand:+ start:4478 stop:5125 length:648 start_codon:yes stop_codon:yes gene_type:complete